MSCGRLGYSTVLRAYSKALGLGMRLTLARTNILYSGTAVSGRALFHEIVQSIIRYPCPRVCTVHMVVPEFTRYLPG